MRVHEDEYAGEAARFAAERSFRSTARRRHSAEGLRGHPAHVVHPVSHPAPTANPWDTPETRDLTRRALEEDIGSCDRTTQACVPDGKTAHGRFLATQNL